MVLVLLLIGWKNGTSFLNQSGGVVNATPIIIRHSNENRSMISRVVAKKIVSRVEIFISRSPFFARDLEQNLFQSFPTPGMRGYPGATKLRVNLQDGGRSTRKENTINKCSKLITLLIRVAPILKVVRNLFQTFHLVDLDGSIWFRYQMIVRA